MDGVKIDPDRINIADDAWEWVETTDDYIRHRAVYERFPDGRVAYVYRTTPRALTGFLEANRQAYDDSQGKRFGEWTRVGSMPLNVLFDPKMQIAEKLREGDHDHLRWWLNKSEDAKPFKTWRGTF